MSQEIAWVDMGDLLSAAKAAGYAIAGDRPVSPRDFVEGLVQSVLTDLRIESMNPSPKGFVMKLQAHIMPIVATTLVKSFRELGGENYVCLEFADHNSQERFELTVQRVFGITPAQKNAKLMAVLRAIVDTIGDPRGQGPGAMSLLPHIEAARALIDSTPASPAAVNPETAQPTLWACYSETRHGDRDISLHLSERAAWEAVGDFVDVSDMTEDEATEFWGLRDTDLAEFRSWFYELLGPTGHTVLIEEVDIPRAPLGGAK